MRQGRRSSNAVSAAVIDDADQAGPIGQRSDQSCTEANGGYSTTAAKPLVVVYWNVAGIAVSNTDNLLDDMENEIMWDVLVLVECSVARQELHLSGIRKNGYLFVLSRTQSVGAQVQSSFTVALELIMRSLFRMNVHFGADFSWGGWEIRLVGGHADARGDRRPYQQSIDDMEYIVDSTPHNHIVILGADIQGPVGPQRAYDDPLMLGEFVMGNHDMAYTCMSNGRSEPKQMDYMATAVPHRWITQASRLECDATVSDHWPPCPQPPADKT